MIELGPNRFQCADGENVTFHFVLQDTRFQAAGTFSQPATAPLNIDVEQLSATFPVSVFTSLEIVYGFTSADGNGVYNITIEGSEPAEGSVASFFDIVLQPIDPGETDAHLYTFTVA